MESIGNCWAETHRLGQEIAKADAVMVEPEQDCPPLPG